MDSALLVLTTKCIVLIQELLPPLPVILDITYQEDSAYHVHPTQLHVLLLVKLPLVTLDSTYQELPVLHVDQMLTIVLTPILLLFVKSDFIYQEVFVTVVDQMLQHVLPIKMP